MWKRETKKLLVLVLSLLFVVSQASSVLAAGVVDSNETTVFSEDTMNEYANENIALFAIAAGLDITDGAYMISQAVPIGNCANYQKYMYFLFLDGLCIGRMVVAYVDGEFTSSFCLAELESITTAFHQGCSLSLFSQDNKLLALVDNEVISVSSPATINNNVFLSSTSESVVLSLKEVVATSTVSEIVREQNALQNSRTSNGVSLNVPYVHNGSSPHDGLGLCWAACICSIASYVTNTPAWTALALYEWLDDNHFHLIYPHPRGVESYETAGFEMFGFDPVRYNSGVMFWETAECIDDGIPVYSGLACAPHSNIFNEERHAVVICGYRTIAGGNYYYELMDPNVNGTVLVSVTSSATSYTYVPEGTDHVYNKWAYTYFVG